MKSHLTSAQRKALLGAHKLERYRRFADRIKAVLAVDEGQPVALVARILLVDESTVRRYVDLFSRGGLEGLISNKHLGAATKLTKAELEELGTWVDEQAPRTVEEVRRYILVEFEVDMCRSQVNEILKRLGFSYIKPKVRPANADVARQSEFRTRYEELKQKLADEDAIYFGDAAHPIHNARPDYGWMRTGKPRVLKTNHGRARLTFHAAVSADGPRVVVEEVKSMTGDAVIAFLTKLERLHPQSKAIHFICDNASYYRSFKVAKWLEQSRIKVHFLPPYSPNLNIAERLWKLFRQEVTSNRFHPTVAEFREACGSFFKSLSRRCSHLKSFFVDKFQALPEMG